MNDQLISLNGLDTERLKPDGSTNNVQNKNMGARERGRDVSSSEKSPEGIDSNQEGKAKTDSDSGKRSHDSMSGDENDPHGSNKKKKHRRKAAGNRRRWKPFEKMSWTERKELEERQSKRAEQVREERFHKGQPMAPFNTTQFVMADHNEPEPDLNGILHHPHHRHREASGSSIGDDAATEPDAPLLVAADDDDADFYSSPSDEEEFLERDFSEEYETVHAERLESMSKEELVQDYLQMEAKLETLHRAVAPRPDSTEQRLNEINVLRSEIERLRDDNEKLLRENNALRKTCGGGGGGGAGDAEMALERPLDRTLGSCSEVAV
ncbi:PREDICTED: protein HEXIM-like [Priapulus caudatus]|uniref:Protein HEXIM-like n=1 Tax=Priapulus caudatus TaxID=37621 RepID=A0ABM1DU28_PRICU|nr:PREDICTED: protein HEXIM-like [Priapulus caudatus]